MKVHIAKRNETFESIAQQYGVSLQDLIGMNTHINYLAGLVPGLKIKLPDINRKDGLTFQEKVQTHFPKVDTAAIDIHSGTTEQADEALQEAEVPHDSADAMPMQEFPQNLSAEGEGDAMLVPLKDVSEEGIADGIKVDIPQSHIGAAKPVTVHQGNMVHQGNTMQQGAVTHHSGVTYQHPAAMQQQAMQAQNHQFSGNKSAQAHQGSAQTEYTHHGAAWGGNGTPGTVVNRPEDAGITVNQTPYQHAYTSTGQSVQTYHGGNHYSEPMNHYAPHWQEPHHSAAVYYDRPPAGNQYSTFIPGPATIIYHGYDPRSFEPIGWEPRQEAPLYPDFPVIYPGGYGYPTRDASPCSGAAYNPHNYLSFYFPDEASYWAAFPWNL